MASPRLHAAKVLVAASWLAAAAIPGSTPARSDTPAEAPRHASAGPVRGSGRDSPQVLFQDLFVTIQARQVFQDGKEFVDAVPRSAPPVILREYRAERPATVAALRHFVEEHFILPQQAAVTPGASNALPMVAHIDQLWSELTRSMPRVPPYSSALALPRPYVVPGGRFREMYYWDSYFTMLGLVQSGRTELVEDMVRDFAYLIDAYGHVPNGTRTYYLSRSQPPFFFAMVGLLSTADPAAAYARYLPQLRREYAYWMQGAARLEAGQAHRRVVSLGGGSILNRYWDDRRTPRDESYAQDRDLASASHRAPQAVFRDVRAAAESGWDFSTRWFADPADRASIDTTQIVPADLNSLLFGLETAIHLGCERSGEAACAREFAQRAAARRTAVDRYLWDAAAGAYLDYRWTRRERITRVSAATLYPLFVSLASADQAAAVAATAERELLKPGGIVATPLESGQQWDSPNGWAPLQWIAVAGLRRYSQPVLAETIACRFLITVATVYDRTGKLVEKYDLIRTDRQGGGGEYPTQDGFGWTNGVVRALGTLYPADAAYTQFGQCPGGK